jgi:hypothetical protein
MPTKTTKRHQQYKIDSKNEIGTPKNLTASESPGTSAFKDKISAIFTQQQACNRCCTTRNLWVKNNIDKK